MAKKPSEAYIKRLLKAKIYENEVAKAYSNLGWKVEHNIFYDEDGDETYQVKLYRDRRCTYPDLTCEKKNGDIKILTEVKSRNGFYVGNPYLIHSDIEKRKKYLFMECYQFDGYMIVSEEEDVDINIAYYLISGDDIYWATMGTLNKNKIYVNDSIFPQTPVLDYYFWGKKYFQKL